MKLRELSSDKKLFKIRLRGMEKKANPPKPNDVQGKGRTGDSGDPQETV